MFDSPLIVTAAGNGDFMPEDLPLALAGLIHATGTRKDDVLLRIGDAPGGDQLLILAAARLGWQKPQIFQADPSPWCHGCHPLGTYPGHRKVSETGESYCPDAGTIANTAIVAESPVSHRGVALLRAGRRNTTALDLAIKMARAGIQTTLWCSKCGPTVPLAEPCRQHSIPSVIASWQAGYLRSAA